VTGKEDVNITNIEPVGNYAVKLVFDDGHRETYAVRVETPEDDHR